VVSINVVIDVAAALAYCDAAIVAAILRAPKLAACITAAAAVVAEVCRDCAGCVRSQSSSLYHEHHVRIILARAGNCSRVGRARSIVYLEGQTALETRGHDSGLTNNRFGDCHHK